MTRRKSTTGKCKWCGKEFTAGRIGSLLKICPARKKQKCVTEKRENSLLNA